MDLDTLSINTIRTLSMDAVQTANSGHRGTPMALAPVAYHIWQRLLRFDPDDPIWPNRDRFVLSARHASMLLYSLLHLARVKAVNPKYEVLGQPSITLDDIRRFRQIDSRCPGHPEYRWTSGVETTTGPLGQGVATSVGMAMASRWMAAYFNRPGCEMFGYDVYALAGAGCMMEGVSSEAIHFGVRERAMTSILNGLSLSKIRPADANEVADAWRLIMRLKHEPAVLVLSRQAMPTLDRTRYAAPQVERGAYVLTADTEPDVILLATGSEVEHCIQAHDLPAAKGITARVVSMPCWALFERQDAAYRDAVLPPVVRARVAVEKASTFGWERYVGLDGRVIRMTSFGASAPLAELQKRFGFTAGTVAAAARALAGKVVA
jgi:transketolase